MNAAETLELIAARDRAGVVIGEAFMVQTHPQWTRLIELVRGGRIGELRSGVSSFCYFIPESRQHSQRSALSAAAR